MNTVAIDLSRQGSDLNGRAAGAVVRDAVVEALRSVAVVDIDCTGIRTSSGSFADELFGILVADHGKAWFKDHVTVRGLSDSTRVAILRAVAERLQLTPAA